MKVNASRFSSFTILMVLSVGAAANDGTGDDVAAVAASSPPAGSDAEKKKKLAECICKIIDDCLPDSHDEEGDRLKKAKCLRIASPNQYKNAYKKALKDKKGKSDAEASATACESAGKPGAHTMGEYGDRAVLFLFPSKTKSGKSLWDLQWVKKVVSHDEINDIIQLRSKDDGVKPPAGVAGGAGEAIKQGIYLYVDLNSYAEDLKFLDANKPQDPSKGGYWGIYKTTLNNLRATYQRLCRKNKDIPGGTHKAAFVRCKAKAAAQYAASRDTYNNRNN